jgi:hypothetical protein
VVRNITIPPENVVRAAIPDGHGAGPERPGGASLGGFADTRKRRISFPCVNSDTCKSQSTAPGFPVILVMRKIVYVLDPCPMIVTEKVGVTGRDHEMAMRESE